MTLFSASRLRTRLILIAALAVLPSFVLALYEPLVERMHARQDAVRDLRELARLGAGQQAAVIEESRHVLLTLAAVPSLTDGDSHACLAILSKVRRHDLAHLSLAVFHSDGSPVCTTASSDAPIADANLLADALVTNTAVVRPQPTDPSRILVAVPLVEPSGRVGRIAVAASSLVSSSQLHVTLGLAPQATVTLFDASRLNPGPEPESIRWAGQQTPPTVREGMAEAAGADVGSRISVTAPVAASLGSGLSIGIGLPVDAVFGEADAALRRNLLLFALVCLFTVGAVLVGGEAFVINPIHTLKQVMQRLAGGDLQARAELAIGVPGLRELGHAVNAMATALESRKRARDHAEQKLRLSEELYRVPFEKAPHPSWLHDIETLRFVEVNRAASEDYGYTRDEFLQMTILDICPPEDVPHVIECVRRLADSTTSASRTGWTHRKKDGTLIGVEMSSMLVTIQGRRLGLVLAHDVSERTMLEEQLRQSQKMEAVGRLATGVAHDFNNLLTAILCYGTLALEKMEAHHPARADIGEICAAGERAAGLTQQLLVFCRHHVLQQQILNLNDVVTRSESLLQRVIGEDVSLVPLLDPDVGCVSADVGQIEQIIMNLAINARDAMPEGGRLIFETQNVDLSQAYADRHAGASPGAHVMLAITDTGIGMTEETRSRMFEPFFTTKEAGKGTGLGLATVYGIVNRSGGLIQVISSVGRGTSIRVDFPSLGKSVKRDSAVETWATPQSGSETVLLVEDEAPVRVTVSKALASHGYEILEASDGRDAVIRAQEHPGPIHLLLTDLVLPTLSGREVAAQVRSLHPEVRVLFMSGYPDQAVMRNGMLGAGDAFLGKPFSPCTLWRKTREVLDAPVDAEVLLSDCGMVRDVAGASCPESVAPNAQQRSTVQEA